MNKKHLLILSIMLFVFSVAVYIYKLNYTNQIPPTTKEEIHISSNSTSNSNVFAGRSMPDGCLGNDIPECYSRNYNDVNFESSTMCDCEVEFNEKLYTEHFNMTVHIEYKELIGMNSFSDTNFDEEFFNNYCQFVCHEFGEQIRNGTYVESK